MMGGIVPWLEQGFGGVELGSTFTRVLSTLGCVVGVGEAEACLFPAAYQSNLSQNL